MLQGSIFGGAGNGRGEAQTSNRGTGQSGMKPPAGAQEGRGGAATVRQPRLASQNTGGDPEHEIPPD